MAHKECNCCHEDNSSSASFMFGIIIGAIAGAIIAVLIYRNNKNEVIKTLKNKIESFFKSFTSDTLVTTSPKKNKTKINIADISTEPVKPHKSTPKVFIRARK
ncbi:MAG: hypothetical protein Q8P53_04585 [Candidatus Shapirobacteria bacterium]|nr:hypothetical protein [Candidatus Shapirobacteria bacterium]